jgi:hypothetical protein
MTSLRPLRCLASPGHAAKPIFYSCSASIGPGAIKNAVFQAFVKYVVPQNEGKTDFGLDFLAVFLR